jgi:four helix bundle protein
MATIKRFEDLDVWKMARAFCMQIHQLSTTGLFAKDFELRNQINRSSGSIMDNIAEGFERNGSREFLQFLHYAKGSAGESRSQIYRAFDRKYINQATLDLQIESILEISRKLSGLIKYLQTSDLRGSGFSEPDISYKLPDSTVDGEDDFTLGLDL